MKFKNRNIVTFFFLFAASIILQAQGWKRTYPTASTIFRTAQTNDNGFIGCGINEESQLIVLKMDEDGTILKTNIFKSISKVSRVQLAKAADGNFLIALNDTSAQMKLVKITPNADSLWAKRVPFAINIQDFQPLMQGNFGVTGSDNTKKAVFVKLNTLGDTVWTKQYPEPTDILNGFVEDNDGTIFWQINDKTNVQPILWVLNPNGNVLNTIRILTGYGFYRLERLKDGNLVACTARELVKFRTDGREVWTIMPKFSTEKDITNIVATEDGGVAVLAYGSNRVLNETELLKVDANGNKQWSNKMTEDIETTPGTDFSLFLLFNLQQTSDKGYLLCGRVENSKNSINRKSGYLIRTIGNGLVYSNILRGNVASDLNKNCKIDAVDLPISNWTVKADGGVNKIFNATTDALGNYNFQLDSGQYKISLFTPNNLWEACYKDSILNIKGFNKIDTFNIPVKPVLTCSGLRVDIGTPLLRRCFDNIYTVTYCNNGTAPVQNAYVEVTLDTLLAFQNATFPVASVKGRTYRFNVGDLDILQCKSFNFIAKVSCETPSVLGRTACTEAHIYPDSICPTWRGAKMEASGRCDRDSLRFTLQNTGQTTTSTPINFVVIEDEIVFLQGSRTFTAGQSLPFAFKPNGKTYRFQATQERGYPTNQLLVAVAVEGCGRNTNGDVSKGFVLQLPEADGDPFVDTDCQSIVGSSESNTKLAFPMGYFQRNPDGKTDHLIEPNTDLEYMIRFQNVGTDTAFNVAIRDTLSAFLEPTSFEMGASSHPCKAELVGANILKFTFTAVRLPDSTTNGAASQGFIKFRIRQKPNLVLGTKISNKAVLYFDFNKPIVTSSTFHTVGTNFLISAIVEKPKTDGIPIKVYPNPFTASAVFELEQTDTFTPLSVGVPSDSKNSIFKLFDATGRLIRTQPFEGSQLRFERENLLGGMYFFTIENSGKRGSGKLIIQ